jgi:hypothetical protein
MFQVFICGDKPYSGGWHSLINERGNVYGRLTVLDFSHLDKNRNACWRVKCSCGSPVFSVRTFFSKPIHWTYGHLRRVFTMRLILGKQFDRLFILALAGRNRHTHLRVVCLCLCGTTFITLRNSILSGRTHSCGCFRRENTARFNTNTKKGARWKNHVYAKRKSRCKKQKQ